MRIVMLEPLGINRDTIQALAKPLVERGHEFVPCYDRIEDKEELIARAEDADVFIIANSPVDRRIIMSAQNLKMISVAFTGVDHVDIQACKQKGVIVCNAAGYSTYAVAELAFGLIFCVLRNIVACNTVIRQGETRQGLTGNELYGKTMGIIGTGVIGLRVAKLAEAFGCKIIAYSRTEKEEAKHLGVEYVTLDTLLSQSDIVSLHLPLTSETRMLINRKRIGLMKPDSILINCARGAVVDSEALAQALNEGKIAGAGIDVFEMEPPIPENHPLLNAKNIIATPHVAFATEESILRRAQITFDNITAWMDGKPQNADKRTV